MSSQTVSSSALLAALAAAPGMFAQIPRAAPESVVTDHARQTIRLSSYRRKVIAVELMLTTCSPAPRFPWTLICDMENQYVQHETSGFRARARSPEGD